MKANHNIHIVENRPWPLLASLAAYLLTLGLICIFHRSSVGLLRASLGLTTIVAFQWWRDVGREAGSQGLHSKIVEANMRWGIVLFIASEGLFFFSFFWAYFHRSLAPSVELGFVWPPVAIESFNPFGVPLLNTIILLSSGLTVTWAHYSMLAGNHWDLSISLGLTIVLGVYFTVLQGYEYLEASFSFRDSVYGRCFFLATGFHGLHVFIGTSFLLGCYLRAWLGQFSINHHFGFEAAAWYWHFVDVVWIFLFIRIYWWGR